MNNQFVQENKKYSSINKIFIKNEVYFLCFFPIWSKFKIIPFGECIQTENKICMTLMKI